jgi:hypothetical protein
VNIALLVIATLVLVAIGVQVAYARAYAGNATTTTKVVWGVNIALLVALVAGLVWYVMLGPGAS